MDNKEAIDVLKDFTKEPYLKHIREATELAIDALEITDYKKTHYVYGDEPICPHCGEVIDDGEDPCECCGQRIDWRS